MRRPTVTCLELVLVDLPFSLHGALGALYVLAKPAPEFLPHLVTLGPLGDVARLYPGLQPLEEVLVAVALGDMEELAVEGGQLAGAEVAHPVHLVAFQVFGALAQHLPVAP